MVCLLHLDFLAVGQSQADLVLDAATEGHPNVDEGLLPPERSGD